MYFAMLGFCWVFPIFSYYSLIHHMDVASPVFRLWLLSLTAKMYTLLAHVLRKHIATGSTTFRYQKLVGILYF